MLTFIKRLKLITVQFNYIINVIVFSIASIRFVAFVLKSGTVSESLI